jgi:sugar lactone lactonase YvrE
MKSLKRLGLIARLALATWLAGILLLNSGSALSATIVSTLAGTGVAGFANGPGNIAQFNYPYGVAVDSMGNVYVPDDANSRVRKITPAGVVSTFAGTGVQGHVDGPGNIAQFNQPNSIAVDGFDNVYVFDYATEYLRKITPAGVVSTLAGSGAQGSADGIGAAASFYNAIGLAADGAGNVYVADIYNQRIRKVTPAGVVSTLAGSLTGLTGHVDALGTAARFRSPQGVAVDSSGNVYVGDTHNYAIRKITPLGMVSTLAGTGVSGHLDGPGNIAQFELPWGLTVDGSGNLYVADKNYIRKITPAGVVTTFAGTGGNGFADGPALTVAQFGTPPGVAVDSSGNLYVADTNNQCIRKIVDSPPCDGQADLWMKDTTSPDLPEDFGVEPTVSQTLFISRDIWVRTSQDATLTSPNPGPDTTLLTDSHYANEHQHQNPTYNGTTPSYVYVKVRNRGCASSAGTEKLRVYWASASTGLPWPGSIGLWNELDCVAGVGINPCPLPVIAPGQDYVIEIPWLASNPASFGGNDHFCLVARIETQPSFPFGMTYPEVSGQWLWQNVAGNNNIVWKNLTVFTSGNGKGKVIVRNTLRNEASLELHFAVPAIEMKNHFLLHGDIFVNLGDSLMKKWRRGGQRAQGFIVVDETTIKVTDPTNAMLGGLIFGAGEEQTIEVRMQLKPDDRTRPGTSFNWDVIQMMPKMKNAKPSAIGGERYILIVPRAAGGKDVRKL